MTSSTASPPLHTTIARGADVLTLLDRRWDDLVLRQALPNPTLLADWLCQLASRERGVPLVCVVEAGPRIVAAGAFALREPAPVAIRVATWLGESLQLLTPDLLVDPECPHAADLIAEALVEEAHAVYLVETPQAGIAAQAFRSGAPWMRFWRDEDSFRVSLPPPRLHRLRQKVAYTTRRAERLGARISVSVADERNEVGNALERFFELHEQRWRGKKDFDARFLTHDLRDWYRSTIASLTPRRGVYIVEVRENDGLVASQLNFLAGHGAMFYAAATQPGGELRGPGHVAMLSSLEYARARGATVMDLGQLAGEAGGPKDRVGPTRVPSGHLAAARSPRAQRALDLAVVVRRRLRRLT